MQPLEVSGAVRLLKRSLGVKWLMYCNSNCFRLLSRYVHNQGCTVKSLEVNGSVERALICSYFSCFVFCFCVFVLVL